MKKNWIWILLFALVVLVYGLSQQWQAQRSDTFETVLLDFVPKDVTRIDIHKTGNAPFSLIHVDDRWLLSQQQLNEEVRSEPVQSLLRLLRDIRTSTLVSQDTDEWPEYGVGKQQGTLVCLHFHGRPETSCVRLGKFAYSETRREVQAYARLEAQKEVFTINGMPLSRFTGEMDDFRDKRLVSIDEKIDSIVFTNDSIAEHWTFNHLRYSTLSYAPPDLYNWYSYAGRMRQLAGSDFADDIDELSLKPLLYWQVKLFYADDSIQISCYRDTSLQRPYLLNSTQFPNTWLSSDSSGLYSIISLPWEHPEMIPEVSF